MTQYFDTLKDIAANDHSNTLLIPHSPSTLTDLFGQLRTAIITGSEMSKHTGSAAPATPPSTLGND